MCRCKIFQKSKKVSVKIKKKKRKEKVDVNITKFQSTNIIYSKFNLYNILIKER